MKKHFIIIYLLVFAVTGCGRQANNKAGSTANDELTTVVSEQDTVLNHVQEVTSHIPSYTVKLVIDMDYFKKETIREIDEGEYEKYGIDRLQYSPGEKYMNCYTESSFSVMEEIWLLEDIITLIVRADEENAILLWLVNYDRDHNYIDSFWVGYDEWAESANLITSLIYIIPDLYIERVYISWSQREDSRIEILPIGEFEVLHTVMSEHEW